ncbi:MAG: cytochrome c [Candidatus Jettenia sp. CY-1]|nr:MAG: cytochrome c [Candidatus Jettenia sp. CY-1]
MKKIRFTLGGLFLFLLGETVLAQDKLPGLVYSGQYLKSTLGSIKQPDQIQHSLDAIYSVGEHPLSTPDLISGKGQEITQISCRFCHSTTYITMQPPLSAATWKNEVYKMINTFGAPIPEADAKQIIAYLQSYYTPETRKQ